MRHCLRGTDRTALPEEIEEAWPLALAEIKASDKQHFFISSELFPFGIIDPEDITKIRDTLKGYKVNVILVLRDVIRG